MCRNIRFPILNFFLFFIVLFFIALFVFVSSFFSGLVYCARFLLLNLLILLIVVKYCSCYRCIWTFFLLHFLKAKKQFLLILCFWKFWFLFRYLTVSFLLSVLKFLFVMHCVVVVLWLTTAFFRYLHIFFFFIFGQCACCYGCFFFFKVFIFK